MTKEVENTQPFITPFLTFLQQGQYKRMKQLEQTQKETNKLFKERLANEEGNRFEFHRYGYVVKFQKKEKRETNHKELLEELTDYVALPLLIQRDVVKFNPNDDVKELVKDFELPNEH